MGRGVREMRGKGLEGSGMEGIKDWRGKVWKWKWRGEGWKG